METGQLYVITGLLLIVNSILWFLLFRKPTHKTPKHIHDWDLWQVRSAIDHSLFTPNGGVPISVQTRSCKTCGLTETKGMYE